LIMRVWCRRFEAPATGSLFGLHKPVFFFLIVSLCFNYLV
jgi:hypothetical protein